MRNVFFYIPLHIEPLYALVIENEEKQEQHLFANQITKDCVAIWGSVGSFPHGWVFFAISFHRRLTGAAVLLWNGVHHLRDMTATAPPGGFIWTSIS